MKALGTGANILWIVETEMGSASVRDPVLPGTYPIINVRTDVLNCFLSVQRNNWKHDKKILRQAIRLLHEKGHFKSVFITPYTSYYVMRYITIGKQPNYVTDGYHTMGT